MMPVVNAIQIGGDIQMKLTLTALTLASAIDPDDLQKLKDTKKCTRCDLR